MRFRHTGCLAGSSSTLTLSCGWNSATRAQRHGVGHGSVKVPHLKVEVHQGALPARRRRPYLRHVVLGQLEDQAGWS